MLRLLLASAVLTASTAAACAPTSQISHTPAPPPTVGSSLIGQDYTGTPRLVVLGTEYGRSIDDNGAESQSWDVECVPPNAPVLTDDSGNLSHTPRLLLIAGTRADDALAQGSPCPHGQVISDDQS
jgi:hypothetical protein